MSAVPNNLLASQLQLADPGDVPFGWNINGLFFDAWLSLNHQNSVTITDHPVELGAPITDNAFNNPRRFSFFIGMSDATTTSRIHISSVDSFNNLVALARKNDFVTLTCKYGTYSNVLIELVDASDDFRTIYGSRFQVNLREIITASTNSTEAVSTNLQATQTNNRGQVTAKSPSIQGLNNLGALAAGASATLWNTIRGVK